MPRVLKATLLLALGFAAAACSDAPPPAAPPSMPSALAGRGGTGACEANAAKLIYDEINSLATGTLQTELRMLFGKVVDTCDATQTTNPAIEPAINFFSHFLYNWGKYLGTDVDGRSAKLITDVNGFIAEPGVIDKTSFSSVGAIGTFDTLVVNGVTTTVVTRAETAEDGTRSGKRETCPLTGCELTTTSPKLAGIILDPKLQRANGEMYAFNPVSSAICRRENLQFVPLCYEVTVVSNRPRRTYPYPYIHVAICPASGQYESLSRLRLAHPQPFAKDASFAEIAPRWNAEAAFSSATFACDRAKEYVIAAAPTISPSRFAAAFERLGTLASRAVEFFGPRSASAGGAGTAGGDLSSLSPIGPLDPQVLRGEWTPAPYGPLTSPYTLERGTWTNSYVSPGSITVQPSLGNLTEKPLVLDQGGGACTACSVLKLTGTFYANIDTTVTASGATYDTTFASHGTYTVSWSSLENKPTVKLAPISVRDNTGKLVAQLAYKSVMSGNVLSFNGTDLSVPWVVGKKQDFVITIHFADPAVAGSTNSVDLSIDGTAVFHAPRFYNESATNIADFHIFFEKIDAGILAIDHVAVERIDRVPDTGTP